jgi:hypothetical protein
MILLTLEAIAGLYQQKIISPSENNLTKGQLKLVVSLNMVLSVYSDT